jgi:hypothetical protein
MRKSFLWIATAVSGVIFAGVAYADTEQTDRGADTRQPMTTTNGNSGNAQNGSREEPCPPRPQLTAAQRRARAEAAQRARDARQAEEDARRAELDRARDAETRAQNEATQAQNEATQARNDADRFRNQQAETQRALESERARSAQLASILAERERVAERHRRHHEVVIRGGGPLHYRPLFTFGFDGGVAGFANQSSLRDTTYVGGSWGGRIGVDFADWIGIEARYFGMANALFAPNAGTGTLITNGGSGVVRLTVPTPYVQPYGFAGVGGYSIATWRPVEGTNQQVSARPNLAVPMGVGLNFPIGRVVSVAAEGMYHALWDWDTLRSTTAPTPNMNGIWNATAVLRFRL